MHKTEDAFCSNCDWSGDATGLPDCPVCGASLAKLDDLDGEDSLVDQKEEKYPEDYLRNAEKDEDLVE